MNGIQPLPWDTTFFGARIARVKYDAGSLDDLIAGARSERVECLYVIVPEAVDSLVQSAIARGARLVTIRSELILDRVELDRGADAVRLATPADEPRLLAAAEGLAGSSRFAADRRFSRERIEEMYRIWARQCLGGGVVAVPAEQVIALVGGRDRAETRHIELVYVEPDAAGRGLGRALLVEALRGATSATVATQSTNTTAVRLYESVGFRTRSVEAILHLWLDEVV